MTVLRLSVSEVRTAFVAATIAVLSLYSAVAQQHQLPNPRLPIPPAHPSPATQTPPLATSSAGPSSSLSSARWTALGPASLNNSGFNSSSTDLVSGRITGIAADPTDANTIYVAAAGGGVWKTTDGGVSWTPTTDGQKTLSMGSIAVAPTNHLRIYAGTGEANNCEDCYRGEGILVSSNGGASWTLETAGGAFAGVTVGQIAVDPTNADVAYAAVGGYGTNGVTNVNQGVWKTIDGGTNWTNTTAAASLPSNVEWSSVVVDPTTPNIVYAAIGIYFGGGTNGVYRSIDGGNTWSILTGAPHGFDSNLGRIALAVSPAARTAGSHVLYMAAANTSNYGLGYFERSDSADAAAPTFTNLTTGTPDFLGGGNSNGQGWYDIAVNVDANGKVYCSGVVDYNNNTHAIITSSNSGVNWTDITNIANYVEPHTDNHAIAFDANNNMLAGNDGGIWRYNPVTPGWTDLNGNLNTIQFEGIGLHPTDSGTILGGSQDNGTELYSDNFVWSQVAGGDGGPAKISQSNGSVCYQEFTDVSIDRSSDGCHSWSGISFGIAGYTVNFYAPYTLDPTNGDHLLFGTDYVNQSTNGGASWTQIGTPHLSNFNPSDLPVDSITFSPGTSVVYAAVGGSFSLGSSIFVTINNGGLWTNVSLPACTQNTNGGIGCRVNQIVTDPNDGTGYTAFAVINKFRSGTGGHVFMTANLGANWTDISGNLPNIPVWSIQIDTDPNKTAYISTDSGVYISPSPYSTWRLLGSGLPHAQGYDLELNGALKIVGVGTHGRGAWEIETAAHAINVTSTVPNGNYYANATIPITITFDTAVTVTGMPKLTLNTSPAGAAFYASGSGTNTLTFNYKVGGQTTGGGKLDYASRGSLGLNGGTIKDADGTAAELTLYAPGAPGSLSANKSIDIPASSAMISPVPNTVLAGPKVTFSWSAVPGATEYALRLGTTLGGNDLYSSGPITSTSVTRGNLPTNGETIYARVTTFYGTNQVYTDCIYTAATASALTSPAPNSLLAGPKVTFTWSTAAGATGYVLNLGTSAGGSDLYSSGTTTATSVIRGNLPTNGLTVYARLITEYGAIWVHTDYVFTAVTQATLNTPTPGSVLTGSTATFTWDPGTGASGYVLMLGTTVGGSDIYNSGTTTKTSITRTNLPTNGQKIYARLITEYGSVWVHADYSYTAQ